MYVGQEATESEIHSLLKFVDMAIEILKTMDECVVAAKAARMLQRASEKAERISLRRRLTRYLSTPAWP